MLFCWHCFKVGSQYHGKSVQSILKYNVTVRYIDGKLFLCDWLITWLTLVTLIQDIYIFSIHFLFINILMTCRQHEYQTVTKYALHMTPLVSWMIWLVTKLGEDIMHINIVTKFGDDWKRITWVRKRKNQFQLRGINL